MGTGSKKGRIIYIGDNPDFFVNGVTVSFDINLKTLATYYEVERIHEKLYPGDNVLYKTQRTIRCTRLLHSSVRSCDPENTALYTNLPLSLFGMVKTWIYVLIASRSRAKTILHLHRGDFFTAHYQSGLRKWLVTRVFKRTDLLVVLSKTIQKEMAEVFPKLNVAALPNRIEKEYAINSLVTEKHTFLFLSNYFETKGIFELLEVFRELEEAYPHISLNCYGKYPNKHLKNRLKTYETDQIKIQGSLSGREKFEAIRSASCLILPSWSEGQPLVILEAISQATPVIATDVGTIAEMLGPEYPLIVKVRDRQDLKKKIIRALESDNIQDLGIQLQNRYRKSYNISGHEKALLGLFHNMF